MDIFIIPTFSGFQTSRQTFFRTWKISDYNENLFSLICGGIGDKRLPFIVAALGGAALWRAHSFFRNRESNGIREVAPHGHSIMLFKGEEGDHQEVTA